MGKGANMTYTFGRRSLLGGGLALGAGAALSACSSDDGGSPGGGSAGGGPAEADSIRPAYIPFDGPEPDLVGDGETGVPNAFLTYPDPPPNTGNVPVGITRDVELMVQVPAVNIPRDNNPWWQKMEEDLGAKFTINGVDSTQYTAKFQTTVAGGQVPEVTQIVTVPQLPQLLESRFTDLTPYLSGDNIAKYPSLAAHPSAAWDMCIINGKIWGITNPRIVAGTVAMTRGDILESKGIDIMPEISDGEDFLSLCREVTDRNAGVFAIGQIPQNWTMTMILESLGAANGWVAEGDRWTSAYETPEYAQALEILTGMYAEGLYHPNTYSDLSSTGVWFDAGVTVFFAQNFATWAGRSSSAKFPVGAVQMPQWDGGGKAAKHLGVPGYGAPVGLAKTDDEARIDELLKFADYLASPFGTREFLTVNYGVDGHNYTLEDGRVNRIADTAEELISGPAYFGAANSVSLHVPGKPDATETLFNYCQEHIPNGVKNPSQGMFSETAVSDGAAANKRLNDVMGEIIQGRRQMTEWEAAVEEWKSDAGEQIGRELAEQAALAEG
ncbi:hypothetical protein CGZ92_11050 [Parenemella sanctibonifatiensis]|uniref:Extracellular solute-binding protein n=2 Tax=Parenemella sanctibonifatiensis TaxID=2016505 RepID=A0A255E189_9ACTN|nr:hypothetical protein CGZ92_11050 [Parenemella sanctibonifatiensis]